MTDAPRGLRLEDDDRPRLEACRRHHQHVVANQGAGDIGPCERPGEDVRVRDDPCDQRTAEQAARVALDDALIAELQAADTVVIGVPMYNFNVTAQFKNWIDAVARAGVTFKYTEKGPVGLLQGKKVYVVTSRGGIHRDQPSDQMTPYLRTVLAFLGMTDVSFVYAEGMAFAAEQGLSQARAQIDELLAA